MIDNFHVHDWNPACADQIMAMANLILSESTRLGGDDLYNNASQFVLSEIGARNAFFEKIRAEKEDEDDEFEEGIKYNTIQNGFFDRASGFLVGMITASSKDLETDLQMVVYRVADIRTKYTTEMATLFYQVNNTENDQ